MIGLEKRLLLVLALGRHPAVEAGVERLLELGGGLSAAAGPVLVVAVPLGLVDARQGGELLEM